MDPQSESSVKQACYNPEDNQQAEVSMPNQERLACEMVASAR